MSPEKKEQADTLLKEYKQFAKEYKKIASFVICPPAVFFERLGKNNKTVALGGQQSAFFENPAQTGMVSPGMLKSVGVSYAIVGHSEVRARGMTNKEVVDATLLLLDKKITPIVCLGEKVRDKDGFYISEIKEQVESLVKGVGPKSFSKVIIAYEPVWAIGTHAVREATVAECQETVMFIRKIIADLVSDKVAKGFTILYGGSVNEVNAKEYLIEGNTQGLLIGRTSLDAKKMKKLLQSLN